MKTRIVSSRSLFLSVSLISIAGGCGGDDDDDGVDAGDVDVDAGAGDYQPVLTTEWTLPPPTSQTPDQYFCADLTVAEEMIVAGFRTISPNGTHHTVLSIGEPDGPDNPSYDCGAGSNRTALLYASGVGTDDFEFPEGVGLRVQAGQQLRLNVHTFNATDSDLTGTSGVAVKLVQAVDTEAEFTFAGPVPFEIPASEEPYEVSGSCAVKEDATVLNWWPHMHQLGTHMKIEVDGEVVHDQPFNFTEQVNYPTVRQITTGQTIDVTCTFVNDTGQVIPFGDSSNREMCFAGFYRYPKYGEAFCDRPFGG